MWICGQLPESVIGLRIEAVDWMWMKFPLIHIQSTRRILSTAVHKKITSYPHICPQVIHNNNEPILCVGQ